MTIYIHFNIRTGKPALKLHNVERISDAGPGSVMVTLQFSNPRKTYTDVSHVAIKPEQE